MDWGIYAAKKLWTPKVKMFGQNFRYTNVHRVGEHHQVVVRDGRAAKVRLVHPRLGPAGRPLRLDLAVVVAARSPGLFRRLSHLRNPR